MNSFPWVRQVQNKLKTTEGRKTGPLAGKASRIRQVERGERGRKVSSRTSVVNHRGYIKLVRIGSSSMKRARSHKLTVS